MDDRKETMLIRYLWHDVPLLLMELDAGGVVLRASRFAQKALGSEIRGRAFSSLLVDFTGGFDLTDVVAMSEPLMLHFDIPSGHPVTYLVRIIPEGSGFLVVGGADVEAMEKLQLEVLGLNRELADLGRQLQKANSELRALNVLKNQFLGMAAHDLRKPVGAIMAYTDFVRDEAAGVLADEHVAFLDRVMQGAERMRQLIDDFLNISIIESGSLAVDRDVTTVGVLLEGAGSVVDVMARTKGVRLDFDGVESDVSVSVDAAKIEQVLINLMGNAVEHSESGQSVSLTVSRSDNGVTFSVRDHGAGLSEEDRAKVFQAFERAGTRKTAGERSVGLGLAIARRIVEAHGGRLGVDGVPGGGSSFWFTVPVESELTHAGGTE